MKKIIIKLGVLVTATMPMISFAATTNLKELMFLATDYMKYAIYLIISLAILMFVWNVFKYFIYGSEDPGAKKEAGLYVMYSVIGFFVILSLWGLVYILTNTFDLNRSAPTLPFGSFNTSDSSVPNPGDPRYIGPVQYVPPTSTTVR